MKMLRDVLAKNIAHFFRKHAQLRTLSVLLLSTLPATAQNIANGYSKQAVDAAVQRQEHNYQMDMLQRITGFRYKPYIGISVVFPRFYGDVMPNTRSVTDLSTLWGINAGVVMDEDEHFMLNFYAFSGWIKSYYQNFSSAVDNHNFSTRINQLDISITYQYSTLFNLLRPYARVGVGILSFNPMGDLKDGNGSYYLYPYPANYPSNISGARATDLAIEFDDVYETDYRRRNLYGDGNYSRLTPIIPLELGINFQLNNFLHIRVGYMLTYTFTDLLDNISGKTARNAQKTYSYNETRNELNANYTSYYNDLVTPPQKRAAALDAGTGNDAYGGLHVSLQVKPFARPSKSRNLMYTGTEMSDDEMVAYQKVVLDNETRGPKSRFTPDKSTEESTYQKKRIPRKFRSVDSNKDGIISDIEVNNSIEQYLEGKSNFTRKDIVKLQEFYRSQKK